MRLLRRREGSGWRLGAVRADQEAMLGRPVRYPGVCCDCWQEMEWVVQLRWMAPWSGRAPTMEGGLRQAADG